MLGPTPMADPHYEQWYRDVFKLAALFLSCLLGTCLFVWAMFWPMDPDQRAQLRLPVSIDAAKDLCRALAVFRDEHYVRCLLAHAASYLFLQAFMIPGTVFINLIGGAMFGMTVGFPLALLYNTVGSIFNYYISKYFGRRFVAYYAQEKMETFRRWVHTHKNELLYRMTFARIFPFTPNWFINVACGQLDVDIVTFSVAIMIGLTPYNYLTNKAGVILSKLTSSDRIIDLQTTLALVLVAVLGFAGPSVVKKLREKRKS